MKTIFVNDIPINFKKLNNLKFKKEDYDTHIDGSSGVVPNKLFSRVLIYDSNIKTIVDLLKKMTKKKFKKIYSITITLKEYKKVLNDVKSMFKVVKAAGGVIVEEETKVKVKCFEKIISTWHTYTKNKKFVLKKTTWFKMKSIDDSGMKPQKKEKIEKVEWMESDKIKEILLNSYKTLNHVIDKFYLMR